MKTIDRQRAQQRPGIPAGKGRSLPTFENRALSQITATVHSLAPFYRELKATVERFSSLATTQQWQRLREYVAPRDSGIAERLENWSSCDIDDVIRGLGDGQGKTCTTVWTFQRRLVCSIVDDSRWVDLIVDTDTGQHLRERFEDRADALARAAALKAQLTATKWCQVKGN